MKKTCSSCKRDKDLSDFGKLPSGKGGYRAQCIECDKRYQARYRAMTKKNPGKTEEYRVDSHTVHNHFYIHFGFTSDLKPYNNEYTKYYQHPLSEQMNKIKQER